jgi:hypothetical protein
LDLLRTSKDDFCASQGVTTADTCYVNVKFPTLKGLPKLKLSDKCKILGASTQDATPKGWGEITGQAEVVPLFWAESKTVLLWKALLTNYAVETVVDLSCSWALATACLESSKSYVGLASCKEHAAFISNVVDLQALRVCTDSQHPLWQQNLESLIKTHFQEILDEPGDGDGEDYVLNDEDDTA